MPLSAGTRLGPYEILAPIGAGGMGEVYKARDTKLDREVAIKVLPAALAHDPERLARFEREAKVLASLNHPNIAQIYGIEESSTSRALVMELVPGETLKAPLPLETARNYARQIAEALEAAHEKGITHRDLKPANIMITPAGVVKVLDFGLAAVTQPSGPSSGDPSNSPTLTMGATQAGMILGTAGYMSPEQAAGQSVDKRADIWAFGVVLYEMLTGQRLFQGDTIAHILADVLRAPIDFDKLPAVTPRGIRDLVKRCLERDVKTRLRDIGEARIAIQNVDKEPEVTVSPAATTSPSGRLPWIAAGVLATVAAVALWALWLSEKPVDHPLVRLDVDLGADVSLSAPSGLGNSAGGAGAILSPDGARLVYVSKNQLFIRRLDQPKASELAGTEAAFAPFFSPDGQWVAFFAGGKLKKISVDGGAVIALCDADSNARGGSWGEDGNIIAALRNASVLSRIPSAGGEPTPLTELSQGEATHRWPQVLPEGKAVLFTTHTVTGGFDEANIEVMSLADHRRKTLQRGGTYGRYLATSKGAGHLVYINKGTLFAVPFDLDALAVHGTPSPLLDQVAYSSGSGAAQFDFSGSGTLLYRGGTAGSGLSTVQWLVGAGKTQPLMAKPGAYVDPKLSPDGQRLVMLAADGSRDIWVYEWPRDTMTRLTFGGGSYDSPVWSPDGRYVAFQSQGGMSWTRADGAGKPQPLTQSRNRQAPRSFTPDGKRLAFYEQSPSSGADLWTVPLENDGAGLRAGKPELFLQTPFNERQPTFSPDGRWLAYSSDESGAYEVYVRPFPDKGGKWQVSNNGGLEPEWSPTGRELFFRGGDNRIMVASYTVKGDSFAADKPRIWSDKPIQDTGLGRNYDLAPDGKRVAALMPVDAPEAQQSQNHIVFLENFSDELRRRAPAGK